MKKYNLSKIYDDSFKKGILDIIKQGMPEGAIYSSKVKPPEGAQVYRTDRGTEYWIPSKKDEPKQAKPKVSSTPKTGYKSFTDAERRSLEKEAMESYRNLGSNAGFLYEAGTSSYGFGKEQNEATEILENKMKSGTYDRKAAEKTAMSLMDNIANNLYDGTDKVDPDTYTPKQKREAAKSWVIDFEDKYAGGEYD